MDKAQLYVYLALKNTIKSKKNLTFLLLHMHPPNLGTIGNAWIPKGISIRTHRIWIKDRRWGSPGGSLGERGYPGSPDPGGPRELPRGQGGLEFHEIFMFSNRFNSCSITCQWEYPGFFFHNTNFLLSFLV